MEQQQKLNILLKQRTELNKAISALQAEVVEPAIIALFQPILDSPNVEAIVWTQYTPYFNDGEPCEFSINGACIQFYTDEGDPWDNDISSFAWSLSDQAYTTYPHHYTAAVQKLEAAGLSTEQAYWQDIQSQWMAIIDEDFFQSYWGDHAKLSVYSDKIEIDDYDHD